MFCFTSGLALMLCLRYLLSIDNLGLHDVSVMFFVFVKSDIALKVYQFMYFLGIESRISALLTYHPLLSELKEGNIYCPKSRTFCSKTL